MSELKGKTGSDFIAHVIDAYEEAIPNHIWDEGSGLDEQQKRDMAAEEYAVAQARVQHERNTRHIARHSIAADRLAFIEENEEELVRVMMLHGGSFAAHLGNAWRNADSGYLVVLRESFGDLLFSYKGFLKGGE